MKVIDAIVIGGGCIGLAITSELSRRFSDVFLLEAGPRLGHGASSRNSGVIHAGFYYQPNSLKAFHCVRGVDLLYDFCFRHSVPHKRIGKLVVAESEEQLPDLERLLDLGRTNGVQGLEIVHRSFIHRLEPNVVSPLALYSPNTGIIETESLIKTLARVAVERGANILTNTAVVGAEVHDDHLVVKTSHGEKVAADLVINAAGLYSDEVARMFGVDDARIYPCRGEYVEFVPRMSGVITRPVYPIPPPAYGHGLGLHFTPNTSGKLYIGPNARYVSSKEDYESDRTPIEVFYESAKRIVPSIKLEDLRLSYSGIRARVVPEEDNRWVDWSFRRQPRNVIHLFGFESPGLTSCLSIAQSIAEMV